MKIKWERRRKKKIRNSRENGRDETRKKKQDTKKIERVGGPPSSQLRKG